MTRLRLIPPDPGDDARLVLYALIVAILVATSWVLHQRMSLPVGWGY